MWLKPQGYGVITDPDKGVAEFDTLTCAHCNRLVHVKAKKRPEDVGGFCRMCMKPVCAGCADGPCTPFEKAIEQAEERERIRRSYEV